MTEEVKPIINIFSLLRNQYSTDDWAYFDEVADGTGSNVNGFCDSMAFNLWPSRGYVIHGHEVKVSRTDWIKERDNPRKADRFFKYCDYWWLVVSDEAIVKEGELPEPWGLMVRKGDRLKVVKKAPLNKDKIAPSQTLFASLVRQINRKDVSKSLLLDSYRKGRLEGEENSDRNYSHKVETLNKELFDLKRSIAQFEADTGINLNWKHPNFKKCFDFAMSYFQRTDSSRQEKIKDAILTDVKQKEWLLEEARRTAQRFAEAFPERELQAPEVP